MNASQKLSQIFVVLSLLLLAAACGDTSSPGTDSSIADSGSADQTVSDSGAPDSSTPDGTKTDVLVHYSFGNQIEGSELTIFVDGRIEHGERSCCPPKTEPQLQPSLGAAELSDLSAKVAAAALVASKSTTGSPTALGSNAGELIAYTADGTRLVLREVVRALQPGDADTINYNPSADAAAIRDLVNAYVKVKMPTTP
ncbi:MAG: hypothetical protein KC503_43510 [Myxococcales bacterium]|nr:hypothetical protein [Myxococcales bacterium]